MRKNIITTFLLLLSGTCTLVAQDAGKISKEEEYFPIVKVSSPEGTLLEVGGLTFLPNGNLGIATRRGDVFIVTNPTSEHPYFKLFASGLHEILGLAYKDGSLFCAQRSELTKLTDTDRDGKADSYETFAAWPVSGHYHEYSFGPKIAPDGSFFVTTNVAFGNEEWWRAESRVPWRGWTLKIHEDGSIEPWATGMRSPAGPGIYDGEFFYTDNQGDWVGSGGLWQVEKGDFTGQPAGLRWTSMAGSPVDLTTEELYAAVDPRREKNENGRYIKPENKVDQKDPMTLYKLKDKFEEVKLPAVWLPHGILGISTSEPLEIPENGFTPFAGQLLIGDQGQSKIMRVYLEKVDGEYQGAAWDFRSGFKSGVLRMAWAPDGSLFVGETNRGWGSAGDANEGLQRVVWNGKVPFEMTEVHAKPDGFEITFTEPVEKSGAEDLASYAISSFIYKYHPVYGSPPIDMINHAVKGVKVSEDGKTVRFIVDAMDRYHIHQLFLEGIRSAETGKPLLHPSAYYTLNSIPTGNKLSMNEVSTKNSAGALAKKEEKPVVITTPDAPKKGKAVAKATPSNVPTDAEVKILMDKWTCTACHQKDKKQVGPAWQDVAKRNYSTDKIQELVYNPQPENWPDYATAMAPMPHVPKEDVLKIATWINSLNDK